MAKKQRPGKRQPTRRTPTKKATSDAKPAASSADLDAKVSAEGSAPGDVSPASANASSASSSAAHSGAKPSTAGKSKVAASPKVTESKEKQFADSIRVAGQRETVEAIVVAFILAMFVRLFVFEVFVIPTGSMAPALMGAHKDVWCQQCGQRFQIGASIEEQDMSVVVGGDCPNCRYPNSLDLANASNDKTFSGDRILVSKFAYAMHEPDRWDVVVFKTPTNPKRNFIKRLVGLPNEILEIYHGDLYSRPLDGSGDSAILRKPEDKLMAMRHLVYDSDFQPEAFVGTELPTRMQAWQPGSATPPEGSWQIERTADGLKAELDGTQSPQQRHWMRYFHDFPTTDQWAAVKAGKPIPDAKPFDGRAITDFYAYNSFYNVRQKLVYDGPPQRSLFGGSREFAKKYESGGTLRQFNSFNFNADDEARAHSGRHWVGDLMVEAEMTTGPSSEEVVVELVEAGVLHQCVIDLKTGQATLQLLLDDQRLNAFDGPEGATVDQVTASTGVQAGDTFSVRLSNFDNQLLLWIDGSLVSFDGPTTFQGAKVRAGAESYPRFEGNENPLDAAPVALGVRGGKASVSHVVLHRDKYYISSKEAGPEIIDYPFDGLHEFLRVYENPSVWSETNFWSLRRRTEFPLADDQFFTMGDNSPQSADARCWGKGRFGGRLPDRYHDDAYSYSDATYVPRELMIGKALFVFWPHPWSGTIPLPNFGRFRLIE